MDEMHAQVAEASNLDRGHELRHLIHLRLLISPVILLAPKVDNIEHKVVCFLFCSPDMLCSGYVRDQLATQEIQI
jgi:hypothetical protein